MTLVAIDFEIVGPIEKRAISLSGPGPHWVGRDAGCGIALIESNVSRRHACLEIVQNGIQVTDASSNGTVLDDLLLRGATRVIPKRSGTLGVGPYNIRFARAERPANQLASNGVEALVVPGAQGAALDGSSTPRKSEPLEIAGIATPQGRPQSSSGQDVDLRRRIHRQMLEYLDLPTRGRSKLDATAMRSEVVAALRRIVADVASVSLAVVAQESLVQELADEALGLGPLERLLSDPAINEIMVVDPRTIFVERSGRLQLTGCRFTDDDSVRAVIERIVTPLGRRIDESTPLVDARLKDGSRVNAVIPPLALRGPCITIRKFAKQPLGMPDLIRYQTVTPEMARFLQRTVKARKNIVISGGTGSGKTTLLNVLSSSIPAHERVVTVEDAAELQLEQPHVVSLEARPPNLEGKGEYSIRDLLKNALRMRPDRIVVGECRGGEAIDMLQAMNTGHDGSLTTTHANSPREAVARIETLCLMAGLDLPVRAIRQQIAASVHVIVQQTRFSDGSRRVTRIAEVVGLNDDDDVELRDIFEYKVVRIEDEGRVEGKFLPTGYLPSFLDQFVALGLIEDGEYL